MLLSVHLCVLLLRACACALFVFSLLRVLFPRVFFVRERASKQEIKTNQAQTQRQAHTHMPARKRHRKFSFPSHSQENPNQAISLRRFLCK